MKLGIDLDGVCYDFVAAWQAHFRWLYPDRYLPEWREWNYWEQDDCDVTMEKWLDVFRDGIRKGYIFWEGAAEPGAIEGLTRLRERGHELVIVTARGVLPQESRWATEHWLSKHKVPHDELIIGDHTSPKNIFNFDVMFDDRVENLEAAHEAGERAICFDHPWNRQWCGERVTSWPEFVKAIEVGK